METNDCTQQNLNCANMPQAELQPKDILAFGTGHLFVAVGTYKGAHAVFVAPVQHGPGPIGTTDKQEEGDLRAIKLGEYVMTFPTEAQAEAVADALCNKFQ